MSLLRHLLVQYRLLRWRKKLKADKGFSLRLRNPELFLRRLNEQGVKYVVLRWYDELPAVLSGVTVDDVDILVEHGSIEGIAAALPFFNVGKKADKVKFDIYSDSGRSGLSYRRMPYYPPSRARHLLDTRVADPRGWFRIAADDYIPALVYHLTYHKRQSSGMRLLPSSGESSRMPSKKDYRSLLMLEAGKEGVALEPLDNLLQAHQWLRERGWSMPFDLIRRWPDQDVWLEALYQHEAGLLDAAATPSEDLVILVTRQEARQHDCEALIIQRLREAADELELVELTPARTRRLLWWARGGNWLDAKQYSLSTPGLIVKCRIPQGAAALKERIRKELSNRHGKHNWLHGTDDAHEALYYLMLLEDQTYTLPLAEEGINETVDRYQSA